MTDQFATYRAILNHHGLRVTPQRLMILQVIDEGHGHLTAEAIGARIHANFPGVHPGTIYRTLDALHEAGMVTMTRLGDRSAVYEMVGGNPHHHLICEHCGKVIEIDDDMLDALRTSLLAQFGFRARADHFAIFGTCKDCPAALASV